MVDDEGGEVWVLGMEEEDDDVDDEGDAHGGLMMVMG